MTQTFYRGRFAPSPTGPLHFGSLVSALASYLEARVHQGEWLLRIDDLDQTRQILGMDSAIMRTLEAFGFEWDGAVAYQSQLIPHYQAALKQLTSAGHTYACQCSRSQIKAVARHGIEGPVYPDTCRDLGLADSGHRAIRLKTDDTTIEFNDALFGPQRQKLHRDIGDFVIRRADGYFAYQLAVVVDDQLADVTHVVRGADLLASTERQIYLQRLLGYAQPHYLHVPLVTDAQGRKLSKSDSAHPVDEANPVASLLDAWHFLNQKAPPQDDGLSLPDFWQWATDHWTPQSMAAHTDTPNE
jgi:glutamyl-Q tRNA(Asp) synthetase